MVQRIVSALVYLIVPAAGIVFFGWDWRPVIVLYWLQNVTMGLLTIIDLGRANPNQAVASGTTFTVNGRPAPARGAKPFFIIFFIFHYGIFTLVHGIFVTLIVSGIFNRLFMSRSTGGAFEVDTTPLPLVPILITWAVGSVVQLAMRWRIPREQLPPMSKLFFSPYPRIFVLHLTIVLGVFLITYFSWPPVAALMLVAMQFVVDLWKPQLPHSR